MKTLLIILVIILIAGCEDNLVPRAALVNSPTVDPPVDPPVVPYVVTIKNHSDYTIDVGQNYQLVDTLLQDQIKTYNADKEIAWNLWYPTGEIYRFNSTKNIELYIHEYQVAHEYLFKIQNNRTVVAVIGALPTSSWKTIGYIRGGETETFGSAIDLQQWRVDGPFYWWIDMPADAGVTYIVDDTGVTKIP